MTDFENWLRQPSTLHGLGVLAAAFGAALTHLVTGNPTYDLFIGGAAYAMVHLGIDDHSAYQLSVEKLVIDAINHADFSTLARDGVATVTLATATTKDTNPNA